MLIDEIHGIAAALGSKLVSTSVLAGGFSHETCLLTLADGQVVARFGGGDPAIEAAVMNAARRHVPVPEILLVLPEGDQRTRPAMVIQYVDGEVLSGVLTADDLRPADAAELGTEVGRVVAGVAVVGFERRGSTARRVAPGWSCARRTRRRWKAMFAVSDLVTRPVGHAVADQAADQIRRWVAHGVPDGV